MGSKSSKPSKSKKESKSKAKKKSDEPLPYYTHALRDNSASASSHKRGDFPAQQRMQQPLHESLFLPRK